MVVQEYLLSILVQFKVHTVRLQLEYQILDFRETHSEFCETCMMDCFCENNEQVKGVIYSPKSFIIEIFHRALNTPVV